MKKRLYIDAWGEIPKKEAKRLQAVGENGIFSFRLDSANKHTTIYRLAEHLGLGQGSEASYYGLFIPPNNDEVIKLRLSDHKSSPSEWPERELYLPNRRYSIVVFNSKSMHIQYSNNCEYIDWTPYDVEGIYVYELCINCKYLIKYWAFLRQILRGIYNGENVENNSIESYAISLKGYESSNDVVHDWNKTVDKITENKQDTNMKTENRKRNVVRLTESQLKQMIAESVKRLLKESSNEFEFGKPINIGRTGNVGDRDRRLIRRQKIFLNGSEVGRLVTIEGSSEEVYYITDADYIPQFTNYVDERPQRIYEEPNFKKFTNYDEALKYAINNFDTIRGLLAL